LAPEIPLLIIPVAPLVVCVMPVRAVLVHKVGADEAELIELAELTTIVPVALADPQPPVKGIL
jgi:hypothetical protein